MEFDYQKLLERVPELVVEYGLQLLAAIAIFIIGKWVAKILKGFFVKSLNKAKVDATVANFAGNLVYGALFAFVIIAALGQVGIQTASFVAMLGAAGLAIGLALQGSLSNFAAGVLMVLFRHCKEGDFIEAAGVAGVVDEVTIFCTKLRTGDNKVVIVPNSAILDGNITNYSALPERRIDLVIGVGYDADLAQTKRILREEVESDPRILKDKDITIGVSELADSSVNFVVRPWVKTSDYWPTYFDLLENIKNALDEANINIPYPQIDLHVSNDLALAKVPA